MGFIYIKNNQQLRRFLNKLIQCQDLLIVGWRSDSGYWMFDEYISKLFDMKKSKIAVLDIFEPNLVNFNKYDVIKITSNIKDFHPDTYNMKNVGVIWEHGPEHVEKTEAINIINNMKNYANFIAIETPRLEYKQDAMYGNPYEEHISEWDFLDYFHNFPDFEIWYNGDHNPPKGVIGAFWSKL